MTLGQTLLRLTNFRSPLLRTVVPSVGAAFAIQAAFAVPSIFAQSEKFYDVSGSLTYLSVTVLSLYLPALRTRAAAALGGGLGSLGPKAAAAGANKVPFPSLLSPFLSGNGGTAGLNWRQVVLSAAVGFWAIRLGSYLFQRVLQQGHDSRFDEIKKSPPKFFVAWMAQATWVSLCTLPVIAINSVPAAVFTAIPRVTATDVVGLALFVGGFAFEITADRQKSRWMDEKKKKLHDEEFMTRGLWQKSQYPNYFGESTLWVGIATVAAGTLILNPVQAGLGLSGTAASRILALGLSYVSPAFVTFLLTKVSGIPLSETKYNKRYGDRKDYQEWKKNTPKFFPKLL